MLGELITNETLDSSSITRSKERGLLYKSLRGYGGSKSLAFISHRQTDTNTAKDVANFLRSSDTAVFLEALETLGNNPDCVTNTIDFGLNASTHLLVIISNNTKGSWWVPYEVGVARNRPIPCGMLILENVLDLPEYLKTTTIIKDSYEITQWANGLPRRVLLKSYREANIRGLPSIRASNPNFSKVQ